MPPDGLSIKSPPSEQPLLLWLVKVLAPMKRTRVKQMLQHGRVLVNGAITTRHDHLVLPEDTISQMPEGSLPPVEFLAQAGGKIAKPPFSIIHSDEHLLVIDKPSGLLSVANGPHKTNTIFAKLLEWLDIQKAGRPHVVHRLDRETSGLMIFARSHQVAESLQTNWETVRKTYLAICEGCPRPPEGVVDNLIEEGRDLKVRVVERPGPDVRRAVSTYKVVSRHQAYSLVEVGLETGRKHQIRVHLAHLGCPVTGDELYGALQNPCGRIALHSWKIQFPHPVTGEALEFEAPMPDGLKKMLTK